MAERRFRDDTCEVVSEFTRVLTSYQITFSPFRTRSNPQRSSEANRKPSLTNREICSTNIRNMQAISTCICKSGHDPDQRQPFGAFSSNISFHRGLRRNHSFRRRLFSFFEHVMAGTRGHLGRQDLVSHLLLTRALVSPCRARWC